METSTDSSQAWLVNDSESIDFKLDRLNLALKGLVEDSLQINEGVFQRPAIVLQTDRADDFSDTFSRIDQDRFLLQVENLGLEAERLKMVSEDYRSFEMRKKSWQTEKKISCGLKDLYLLKENVLKLVDKVQRENVCQSTLQLGSVLIPVEINSFQQDFPNKQAVSKSVASFSCLKQKLQRDYIEKLELQVEELRSQKGCIKFGIDLVRDMKRCYQNLVQPQIQVRFQDVPQRSNLIFTIEIQRLKKQKKANDQLRSQLLWQTNQAMILKTQYKNKLEQLTNQREQLWKLNQEIKKIKVQILLDRQNLNKQISDFQQKKSETTLQKEQEKNQIARKVTPQATSRKPPRSFIRKRAQGEIQKPVSKLGWEIEQLEKKLKFAKGEEKEDIEMKLIRLKTKHSNLRSMVAMSQSHSRSMIGLKKSASHIIQGGPQRRLNRSSIEKHSEINLDLSSAQTCQSSEGSVR